MNCARCAREILDEVPRCLYCGWTPDAKLAEVEGTGRVQAVRYRCGATLGPFLSSAVFFGAAAAAFAWAGFRADPEDRTGYIAAVAFLLFAGPVLAVVQIIRRRFSWVDVVPDEGLRWGHGGCVRWDELQAVERYPGIFGYQDGLEGLAAILGHGHAAYVNGCAVLPAALLAFVFLPVLSVLSPWHARVTLTLRNGERVVLRDLEDSETFTRQVRYKIADR